MSHEAGNDPSTKENIHQAKQAAVGRASATPSGVSIPDTAHGVDAHMDRIAAQSRTAHAPREVRKGIEGHRLELQLAALARGKATRPAAASTAETGASDGAIAVSLISRDQSTMQPAGASALAEGRAQSVNRPVQPRAKTNRPEKPVPGARQRESSPAMPSVGALHPTAPLRPCVVGGHPDVPPPPPRQRHGTDNYPGRLPERDRDGYTR